MILSTLLAVYGQIEESHATVSLSNLKPYSDSPDIPQSERGFLPD